MKFEIVYVMASHRGEGYMVRLHCGRRVYNGERLYTRHQDAVKAARRTGATRVEGE